MAALADCIRTWLVRHRRWSSPLYVAGESYGTTRGAALADKLQESGVALSGLILVSCAMDLQSLVFAPRNDLPFALFLPGFACAAQYHGKLSGPPAQTPAAARAAAEAFVAEDYLPALHAGARLSEPRRRRIAKRVAELCGLPVALVEEKNLRISDGTFFFELLRDRGQIVGRLEARVTGTHGREPHPRLGVRSGDRGPRGALHDGRQRVPLRRARRRHDGALRGDVDGGQQAVELEPRRGEGQRLRLDEPGSVARAAPQSAPARSGRERALRPRHALSASDWSVAQLDVPPDVLARVRHHYYDAGHMMYTREADMKKLKRDLAAWLQAPAAGSAAA